VIGDVAPPPKIKFSKLVIFRTENGYDYIEYLFAKEIRQEGTVSS
jgi:hypothetical protein